MRKGDALEAVCKAMREAGDVRARRAAWSLLLSAAVAVVAATCALSGCGNFKNPFGRRVASLSEVPATGLAYRVEADFPVSRIPPALIADEAATETIPAIDKDFNSRRKDDRLLRTVLSPEGQRALALYEAGDTPEGEFRIDIYAADGTFLTNIMPANISGAFPLTPAWSPDGSSIAFIARESPDAEATRKRGGASEARDPATLAPDPSATVMPLIAPVAAFETEQIYVCNRDGRNLRPLTTRAGLIYFAFSWSPNNSSLAALACKEDEWTANANEGFAPKGRPRIIALAGGERLLDDRSTNVLPAWSPDNAKVATAYETDVVIYDTASNTPTAATLSLRDPLLAASRQYDTALAANTQKESGKANSSAAKEATRADGAATPLSFNPVVKMLWVEPEGILAETAFLRIYRDVPPIRRYERWHVLHLSPQAALLSRVRVRTTVALAPRFVAHI